MDPAPVPRIHCGPAPDTRHNERNLMATTMNGTVFKRCGCTETYTRPDGSTARRQLGQACPKLRTRDGHRAREHGTWRFQLEVPLTAGGPRTPARQLPHRTRHPHRPHGGDRPAAPG